MFTSAIGRNEFNKCEDISVGGYFICESTVKKYVSNILNKLNLKNRTEVIYFLYNNYEKQFI